jgi:hypothetical protein
VDASGNVYVTGTTESPDFPTTVGTNQTLQGNTDAFVTKFASDGTLLYSTLVGGICDEEGYAIAVDTAGNAYIAGRLRNCPSLDLPEGAMVAKLDPGGALVYRFILGSPLFDYTFATAIAVDSEGNAYITGSSKTSFDLPTTPGALRTNSCGGIAEHGFVAKINPAGSALVYCTYLCGSGEDSPTAIAVDSAGNAYVGGATTSYDFPILNPFQPTHRGGVAAESGFLSKLNSTGSALIFSTYLGGTYQTVINGLALDPTGNVYVAGWTAGSDFPTTAGVVQSNGPSSLCYYAGICADAFVTKVSPEGSMLYSTLLGGEGHDEGTGIAVNAAGEVYVAGTTASTVFPLRNSVQAKLLGPDDAFLTKLNSDASRILFSSYLGGGRLTNSNSQTEGSEEAPGVALGTNGRVWLTGLTTSYDFPITADAWQSNSARVSCVLPGEPCGDLFVTELTAEGPPDIVPPCHLDVTPTEFSPGGGIVTAHWAGIPWPSTNDSIMLFQLGFVADIWLFVPTYPTTGAAEGTMAVPLPTDLASGTYELRLMGPTPESAPLLTVLARSEPLTVNGPIILVPALGPGRTFRFRVTGAAPGTYHVEATQTLWPPNWQVIGTLIVQPGDTPEFAESIDAAVQRRFFRVSR